MYHTKKEGRPNIDISKTCDQIKLEEFAQVFEETLPVLADANVPERWEHFKNAAYNIALSTFGKKTKKTCLKYIWKSWCQPSRKRALAACPSEYNLQALRAACSKVQQTARKCSNDYWLQLCSQIQIAVDTGNIKEMYDGIKQALGPIQKKSAPLKTATGMIIQDRAQQMEDWV